MALRPGDGFNGSEMTTKTPRKAKAVVHLTPEERAANGKAARAEVPRSVAWRVGAGAPTAAIRSSCSRSRPPPACPSWFRSATGGCSCRRSRSFAVRPYPMAADLAGIARGPGCRCSSAAMRICRTSAASPRPTGRLVFSVNDFDETLPGPFEWDVKRLRGQLRGRRPGPRLRRKATAGDQLRRGPLLPRGDEELRRDAATSSSGTRASTSTSSSRQLGTSTSPKAGQAVRAQRGQGAHEGQPEGVRQAHRASSTANRGSSSDPPLIVPIEEILPPDEHRQAR